MSEHSKCDSMNVTIMSHGHEGVFYGRDGGIINIEEMVNLFNNQKCPSLQNKPKVSVTRFTYHSAVFLINFSVELDWT